MNSSSKLLQPPLDADAAASSEPKEKLHGSVESSAPASLEDASDCGGHAKKQRVEQAGAPDN